MYRYSIIGNSLYLNYAFNQGTAGTAGTGGFYTYAIPTLPDGVTVDTTDITFSTSTNSTGNKGTRFGTFSPHNVALPDTALGSVYLLSSGGIVCFTEAGDGAAANVIHSTGSYHYGLTTLTINWEAIIPLTVI